MLTSQILFQSMVHLWSVRCKQKSLRGTLRTWDKENLIGIPFLSPCTPHGCCLLFPVWNVDVSPEGAVAKLGPWRDHHGNEHLCTVDDGVERQEESPSSQTFFSEIRKFLGVKLHFFYCFQKSAFLSDRDLCIWKYKCCK